MPLFRYKAVQTTGDVVEGEREALDRSAVIRWLNESGHVPIRADEVRHAAAPGWLTRDLFGSRRASRHDIMIFTRELATLLLSGVDLERALQIVASLAEKSALRSMAQSVLDGVRNGKSLADALDVHSEQLPPSYVSMVRAGEAGGALAVVFGRLADVLERTHAARENLRSTLVYPTILLLMAIASVVIMVTVVLPQFEPLFVGSGKTMPLLTRAMLAASHAVQDYGLIGLGVAAAAWFAVRRRLRDPDVRRAWDARLLDLPVVGALIAKIEVARMTRTLGTLLQNGVATIAAIDIVRQTVVNRALAQSLAEVADRVKSGVAISQALADVRRFPALVKHLIMIGEETGQIELMLLRAADIYDEESQRTMRRLMSLLLPGLTILLGLFIAAIIASVFLAILSINQLAR